MDFVLYSNLFDFIILIIYFINIIITGILSFKEIKNINKNKNESQKPIIYNNGIYAFTKITIILYVIIFIVLIINLAYKFNFISIFSLLFYLSFFFGAYKNKNKNVKNLSYDNKADYVNTILLYLLFFSYNATPVYINSFAPIPHTMKEYLLLIFIFIKLVFFSYCIITNIFIFLSNIIILFNKKWGKFKNIVKNKIYKAFEFRFYGFNLSINKKKQKLFNIRYSDFFYYLSLFLNIQFYDAYFNYFFKMGI